MKKLHLILLLLSIALSNFAQTMGEAFYIYRNDGEFNAFFRNDVDSIVYSNYDNDSIYFDEAVMQIVYTQDSIYRIPLAAIDSVGFVTPETKYQPDVKLIEGEMRLYVETQDSLTLFFKKNTPENILPKIGDKLATLEMSEVFPIGFAGEVVEIVRNSDNVKVNCIATSLSEIFECYYGTYQTEYNDTRALEQDVKRHRMKDIAIYSPGKLTKRLIDDHEFENSYQPNEELSFNISTIKADISVTPVIKSSAFVIVNPLYGVNAILTVTGNYEIEEDFSLMGGISWKKDFDFTSDKARWPIAPLVDFFIHLGAFIQANSELAIEQKWIQKVRSIFHWEYGSKNEQVVKPARKSIIKEYSNHSGLAAVNGYIGAGIFLEAGFDFVHTKKLDIANVNLRVEAGANLEGNLVLSQKDVETAKTSTAIYEQLRDSELNLNWFYGVTANAQFWKWGISHDVKIGNIPLNNKGKIFSCAMAPTFSEVKAEWGKDDFSIIDTQANVSCPAWLGGRCIKSDAGFVLKNPMLSLVTMVRKEH